MPTVRKIIYKIPWLIIIGFVVLSFQMIYAAGYEVVGFCPEKFNKAYDKKGELVLCTVTPLKTKPLECPEHSAQFPDPQNDKNTVCGTMPIFKPVESKISAETSVGKFTHEAKYDIPCVGTKCAKTSTAAGWIARIYQFGLGIAGLAAFASIVYGAFKYVLSAGNIVDQKDARDQITQAILGLVLLFGSYLILKTINPELVQLKESPGDMISIPELKEKEMQKSSNNSPKGGGGGKN